MKTARLRTLAREPLAPGALMPGPAGRQPGGRRRRCTRRSAACSTASGASRVTLVLPDGLARLALVETPVGRRRRASTCASAWSSRLPWPAAEASVDTLAAGGSRVVGAAVGRASVAEYEQAAVAARAPRSSRCSWRRSWRSRACCARARARPCTRCSETWRSASRFVRDGALVGLRSRRRDRSSGEASRLAEEMRRLQAASGNGHAGVPLALSGSDAPAAARRPRRGRRCRPLAAVGAAGRRRGRLARGTAAVTRQPDFETAPRRSARRRAGRARWLAAGVLALGRSPATRRSARATRRAPPARDSPR